MKYRIVIDRPFGRIELEGESLEEIARASGPDGLEPKEVSRLLSISGRSMAGYAARMSEMKREGFLIKEGDMYKLSVRGRSWVEEVISRLRA